MTQRRFSFLLPLSVFLMALAHRAACATGVRAGLEIVLRAALPALFPFLVLSTLLTDSLRGARGRLVPFLPLILGMLCGSPVGAKVSGDLYRQGALTRAQARRLVFASGGVGPAFLAGVCGAEIFGREVLGWLLWALQVLVALILYFIYPLLFRKKEEEEAASPLPGAAPSFWESFPRAVREGAKLFLTLSSFILFFSFFTELLLALFPTQNHGLRGALALSMELVGGISRLKGMSLSLALPLAAAGVGWGGLSIHLQALTVLSQNRLPFRDHLAGRGIMALLLPIFAGIFQKLL